MRIGVVRYWAGRPAAEHEVIARLRAAGEARGHQLVDLNPDGSVLDAGPGSPAADLDLVLNLHFSSPKALDVPHAGFLWSPIELYHLFDFPRVLANQLSHDYFVTCGSRVVESALAPFRPDAFGPGTQLPVVNHTVPERYLAPERRPDRRLFYVGVNWERNGASAGRHGELLRTIDAADVSTIYGPLLVDGVEPWAGYRTYRGELPFDGWSVVEAIARAGTALIVSSPAHYRENVMSSRPFESAAAGVPMISERHPFMLEHFADAALFFDERAPARDQAEEIIGLVRRLNADPELAVDLATRAQAVLKESFNLDEQLDGLCRWVSEQTASARRSSGHEAVDVTVVVAPTGPVQDFTTWCDENKAVLARFARVVLAAPSRDARWQRAADVIGSGTRLEVPTRPDTGWSERAALAAMTIDGPLCFLLGVETLWKGYPEVVAAAGATQTTALIPAVAFPDGRAQEANARLPRLLSATSNWWELPVASVVTSAARVRELVGLLGPGLHLGSLAEEGRVQQSPPRTFVPVLTLDDLSEVGWTVGEITGMERHRDAAYAQALPQSLTRSLPESLLRTDHPGGAGAFTGVWDRVAATVRRSALPVPVKKAMIRGGKAVLRPNRRH